MEKFLYYLKQNIDEMAKVSKWNAKEVLSLQYAGSYEYFLVSILDKEFLLVRPYEQETISKMGTQIRIIEEKTGYDVAILVEESTVYRRKMMLKERIAFVDSNQQVYLPFMALHIKTQRERSLKQVIQEKFTPATQLIFLAILYLDKEEFYIEELTEKLNLSTMTIVRGTDELKRIGVVDYVIGGQTGRKKIFTRIPQKKYYQIGKEYLRNPVKKEIYVREIPKDLRVLKSGLIALGEQTMLGEPRQEVYAVSIAKEKELKNLEVTKEQGMEENLPRIQILKYDVENLTNNEYVDPITLILSLPQKDDRIEIAIDELMEGEKWFVE